MCEVSRCCSDLTSLAMFFSLLYSSLLYNSVLCSPHVACKGNLRPCDHVALSMQAWSGLAAVQMPPQLRMCH
jgi:hypothetical protein